MAISRYTRDTIIKNGTTLRTASAFRMIRNAVRTGKIRTRAITLHGYARLDTLAGQYYGDGRYWWVIAAASGIGWGMQIPAGTNIKIPDIGQVVSLIT